MDTKLCGNPRSCRMPFVKLEYLDHNPQTILELVEQFSRKLTIIMCFPLHLKKLENEAKLLWNVYTCIVPAHRIEDHLNCEFKKGGRGNLGIARQNRIAGNLLSQTSHNEYSINNISQKFDDRVSFVDVYKNGASRYSSRLPDHFTASMHTYCKRTSHRSKYVEHVTRHMWMSQSWAWGTSIDTVV